MTRLLFATDFHGQRPAYDALVAHARARRPDAVVLGGDLLPFPMVGEDPIEAQRRFIDDDLRAVLATLAAAGVRTYAIHGNDDWEAAVQHMAALSGEGLLHWVHRRAEPLAPGWSIAGLGLVPVTPFLMKDFDRRDHPAWQLTIEPHTLLFSDTGPVREVGLDDVLSRPTIEAELDALARLSDPARTVYVVHTPPADCLLDIMHGGHHIGSPALRRFLERHQPPLSLHGHVHESPDLSGTFEDRIGATIAINPGASALGFRGVLVDLERLSVELVRDESRRA